MPKRTPAVRKPTAAPRPDPLQEVAKIAGQIADTAATLRKSLARMEGVCRTITTGQTAEVVEHKVRTIVGRIKSIRRAAREWAELLGKLEAAHSA